MNHEQIQELLSGYKDGELAGPDAARVESHLKTCAECALTLKDWDALGKAFFAPPPAPSRAQTELFVRSVMSRIEEEETSVWIPLRWLVPALGLALASLIVTALPPVGGPDDFAGTMTQSPAASGVDAVLGAP